MTNFSEYSRHSDREAIGDGSDGGDGGSGGKGGYIPNGSNNDGMHDIADAGNGGNGGNKIYDILYSNGVTQSLITDVACGKEGALGSRGPVLDPGEENTGKYGSNGVAGTAGSTDSSYFSEFEALFQ